VQVQPLQSACTCTMKAQCIDGIEKETDEIRLLLTICRGLCHPSSISKAMSGVQSKGACHHRADTRQFESTQHSLTSVQRAVNTSYTWSTLTPAQFMRKKPHVLLTLQGCTQKDLPGQTEEGRTSLPSSSLACNHLTLLPCVH
jgi:hypothetical protein